MTSKEKVFTFPYPLFPEEVQNKTNTQTVSTTNNNNANSSLKNPANLQQLYSIVAEHQCRMSLLYAWESITKVYNACVGDKTKKEELMAAWKRLPYEEKSRYVLEVSMKNNNPPAAGEKRKTDVVVVATVEDKQTNQDKNKMLMKPQEEAEEESTTTKKKRSRYSKTQPEPKMTPYRLPIKKPENVPNSSEPVEKKTKKNNVSPIATTAFANNCDNSSAQSSEILNLSKKKTSKASTTTTTTTTTTSTVNIRHTDDGGGGKCSQSKDDERDDDDTAAAAAALDDENHPIVSLPTLKQSTSKPLAFTATSSRKKKKTTKSSEDVTFVEKADKFVQTTTTDRKDYELKELEVIEAKCRIELLQLKMKLLTRKLWLLSSSSSSLPTTTTTTTMVVVYSWREPLPTNNSSTTTTTQ